MYYIPFIIIFTILIIFVAKAKPLTKSSHKIYFTHTDLKENFKIASDTIKPFFARKQIDEKLKILAMTPPPKKIIYSAMCYSMYLPPDRIKYICPFCGEKTIYKGGKTDSDWQNLYEILEHGIYTCKRQLNKVEGIHIAIDESQFCKKCSPFIEKPELCLLVNIEGQQDTTKICNITVKDILLITEFLNNKISLVTGEGEEPLLDYIDRIQELLGLKINNEKND